MKSGYSQSTVATILSLIKDQKKDSDVRKILRVPRETKFDLTKVNTIQDCRMVISNSGDDEEREAARKKLIEIVTELEKTASDFKTLRDFLFHVDCDCPIGLVVVNKILALPDTDLTRCGELISSFRSGLAEELVKEKIRSLVNPIITSTTDKKVCWGIWNLLHNHDMPLKMSVLHRVVDLSKDPQELFNIITHPRDFDVESRTVWLAVDKIIDLSYSLKLLRELYNWWKERSGRWITANNDSCLNKITKKMEVIAHRYLDNEFNSLNLLCYIHFKLPHESYLYPRYRERISWLVNKKIEKEERVEQLLYLHQYPQEDSKLLEKAYKNSRTLENFAAVARKAQYYGKQLIFDACVIKMADLIEKDCEQPAQV
ncbi:MAG: hypothetical protein WCF94_00515 [bacterium]